MAATEIRMNENFREIVSRYTPTTGNTINANTLGRSEMIFIQPAGLLAALTVNLPSASTAREGQIIRIFITQIVTAFTVSATGGGSVIGSAPDTTIINSSCCYQYVNSNGAGTWCMVYPQN